MRWLWPASLFLLACSAEDVEIPSYQIGLFPKVAHSGFNPNATFKVMFATGARDPKWTVADPSIATIAPAEAPKKTGANVSELKFALVTATKAGQTTVTMTGNGTTLTSKLIVKPYTDEQLAIGRTRYEAASTDATRTPCAQCHAKPDGVDHSPFKMAGFDDAVILGVIQEATYPESGTGGSTTSAYAPIGPLKFKEHKWNLADAEKDGILAHLRSLPLGGAN